MSVVGETFPRRNNLLAVVHVESEGQAVRNVGRARENGSQGAFLIGHTMTARELLNVYLKVRRTHDDFWIGVNFLDMTIEGTILTAGRNQIQGLWIDNIGYDEDDPDDVCRSVRLIPEIKEKHGASRTLLFGGVAFKYQRQVVNPENAARLVAPFVDVVTMSGDATGNPPSIEKITGMKRAIGKKPLAIASGINPRNVTSYYADTSFFLVATGISDSHTELNPEKIRDFVDRMLK